MNENLDWTLPNWLDDAIDLNILVYDHDAKGNITKRLLYLLVAEYKKRLKDKPHTIFLPDDYYVECDLFEQPTKAYGCDLQYIDMSTINEYYKKRGCSYAYTCTTLLICQGKYSMLGCV